MLQSQVTKKNKENVNFKDSRPSKLFVLYGEIEASGPYKSASAKGSVGQGGFKNKVGIVNKNSTGVIKTVFLPNEDMNKLRIEVEELKAFQKSQRGFYGEFLTAMDNDEVIRQTEFSNIETDRKFILFSLPKCQRRSVNYKSVKLKEKGRII